MMTMTEGILLEKLWLIHVGKELGHYQMKYNFLLRTLQMELNYKVLDPVVTVD
jgi:hypothetical protein